MDMQEQFDYPNGFGRAVEWLEALDYLYDTKEADGAYENVQYHLLASDVQTNIADRYKAMKLIAKLYADRFEGPPSYLDIGSSIGQGIKLLAYNRSSDYQDLAFEDMTLASVLTPEELIAAKEKKYFPRPDNRLTRLANTALRETVGFGYMQGVDKSHIVDQKTGGIDPKTKQWVKYSHYPSELADGHTLQRFDAIAQIDPLYQRVRMKELDILEDEDFEEFLKFLGGKRFQIISCITMLYQIPDARLKSKLQDRLRILTDDNGIIVPQDARKGKFETPYEYTTSIVDTSFTGWNEEPILHWENARCRSAAVGQGEMLINGKMVQIDTALEDVYSDTKN